MAVRFLKDDYAGKRGVVRSDMKAEEERVLVLIGTAEYVSAESTPKTDAGYDRRDMQAKPRAKRPRTKQSVAG